MLGFLFVTFPTAYKTLYTGTLTPPQASLETSSSTTNIFDFGPIRIDQKLLGLTVPSQQPLRIVIPSRKIDLSVVEAPVINGYWELSETTASHGVGSANPGEIGNTVIFAHAREGLFLPIRDIQVSEVIYVLTKDRWYRYTVAQTQLVDPNQVEVIAPTPDETLTLFTCSGFFDTKRLIVIAKPQR
ncbi:hypothetical protein A3A79_00375 [Candidatus Gottesmanbacteria bacterium RIFCSPLOWO2_01_FULL_43_11b]|uniref:Sortase n=1 Tax=Candidatus Gottesmanbacteria bacterium RIFCSPLOWO2_01_FULL_43_11b TaxID=1798392 RepID=A0A1F6AFX9_9BACT|nr:MAG: hypothetical protein A3A79_00375 [Candidatus Gottesmanbacteria bacterium RIFCSPLOWO2_01_FULL_43_11b]